MKRICIFCGSSQGSRPEYRVAAEELGAELAQRNVGLVYGGTSVGLMGVLADAVLKAGGEAVGVIPERLMAREVGAQRAYQAPRGALDARAQGAHLAADGNERCWTRHNSGRVGLLSPQGATLGSRQYARSSSGRCSRSPNRQTSRLAGDDSHHPFGAQERSHTKS